VSSKWKSCIVREEQQVQTNGAVLSWKASGTMLRLLDNGWKPLSQNPVQLCDDIMCLVLLIGWFIRWCSGVCSLFDKPQFSVYTYRIVFDESICKGHLNNDIHGPRCKSLAHDLDIVGALYILEQSRYCDFLRNSPLTNDSHQLLDSSLCVDERLIWVCSWLLVAHSYLYFQELHKAGNALQINGL